MTLNLQPRAFLFYTFGGTVYIVNSLKAISFFRGRSVLWAALAIGVHSHSFSDCWHANWIEYSGLESNVTRISRSFCLYLTVWFYSRRLDWGSALGTS